MARLQAAGVRLVALFSPEHGFRGAADPGAAVASSIDSATGLPIYSLYGRSPPPPTRCSRASTSCWSICQDAGARYYTYLFTTIEVMRAAARRGIRRRGARPARTRSAARCRATCSTPRIASPVGQLAVPMRHGMTLGELARLARSDLGLDDAISRVVPVAGWRRAMPLDATGLPFVPPSPNLRSLESLFHYPGLCLFEGTNLSRGPRHRTRRSSRSGRRGSTPPRCCAAVRGGGLPGVRFERRRLHPERGRATGSMPTRRSPASGSTVTDRERYDPTATAVHLLAAVRGVQREHGSPGFPAHFDRLAGGPTLRRQIEAGSVARRRSSRAGRRNSSRFSRAAAAVL